MLNLLKHIQRHMAKERWRTGWNEWKQMIQNKSLWENWDESKNASIYPFRAATTDINTCSRTNTHTCRACWNRERAMRSLCGWAKRLWGWNPSLTHGLVHTCTLPFNLVHWQRLDERERETERRKLTNRWPEQKRRPQKQSQSWRAKEEWGV